MEILDAHQHLGIFADFTKAVANANVNESPEDMEYRTRIQAMDAMGVGRGIIGPAYQYLMPEGIVDTARLNDQIANFRDRDLDRFPYAIAAIEPRHGEVALDEIRRVKRDLDMVGVMWHNRLQGCYVDTPWMRKCMTVVKDEGMVPFVHCHHGSLLESPWRLERLALEFPDLTFLVLDGLSGYEETELFYDICTRRENIVFDTGMWAGGSTKLDQAANILGAHRLVFGSGLYSHPQSGGTSHIVDAVRNSQLSTNEKERIFSSNLYEILGRSTESG
ncbi:amidohydrolase family protein [Dehalococcoidia bacterium]|nr:amidohydrolase family protein [Dehalococcoidia bacterium]